MRRNGNDDVVVLAPTYDVAQVQGLIRMYGSSVELRCGDLVIT